MFYVDLFQTNKHLDGFQSWSSAVTFSHDPLLSLSVMIHCCHFQSWSSAVTFSHDPLLSLSVMIHCSPFLSATVRPRMNNQWTASCSVVTVYRNMRLGRMSHVGKKLRINFGKKHVFVPRMLLNFESSHIKKLHVATKWIFLLNFLCSHCHCNVMDITDSVGWN